MSGVGDGDMVKLINSVIRNSTGAWFESRNSKIWARDRSQGIITPRQNYLQKKIQMVVDKCEEMEAPVRILGLKPRARGSTTYFTALGYTLMRRTSTSAVFIGGQSDQTVGLWNMMKTYHANDKFDWGNTGDVNEKGAVFSNGSRAKKETAKDVQAGIGDTYQLLHACVPGDTLVLGECGKPTRVDALRVGSRVVTHNGNVTKVTAVTSGANPKGDLYRVIPATGLPASLTWDHPIWTKRGWTLPKDMTVKDFVSLPIRKITRKHKSAVLPSCGARPQGGGRQRDFSGAVVPLNYGVGYFVGFYLAEGCLCYAEGKYPARIMLAHDCDNRSYCDKAVKFVSKWTTSVTERNNTGSRTRHRILQAAALGEWMEREFGSAKVGEKFIPDWVFAAGEEFCRGLVVGYLSGDGSKRGAKQQGKTYNRVNAKSVYPSLLPQIRDLVAALGWGWSALKFLKGGNRHGRNCRDIWMCDWHGAAGAKIREEMGLLVFLQERAYHTTRHHIEDGKVWIKVKAIERVPCDTVWDVSVEHKDHSFCLPGFAISNTEAARWSQYGVANASGVMVNILKAVPLLPHTYVFLESTAEMAGGDFYDRWLHAVDADDFLSGAVELKQGDYIRVFAAWFEFEESALPNRLSPEERVEIENTLDAEEWYRGEKELRELYGVTGEDGVTRLGNTVKTVDWIDQLAWRRYAIEKECAKDRVNFDRDFPHSWQDAFVKAGNTRFNSSGMAVLRRRLTAVVPKHGILEATKDKQLAFRQTTQGEATVTIFEKPTSGMKYLLSCDPMTGITQTGSKDPDRHGVFVLRKGFMDSKGRWHRPATVARIVQCRWDIDVLELAIWRLAKYYGGTSGCLIAVEINMDRGLVELLKQRGANLYRREVFNRIDYKTTEAYGYQTNARTRENMIETLAAAIREWDTTGAGIDIWCPQALEQCENFVRKANGRSEAADGFKDDDVIAVAMGLELIDHATTYHAAAAVRGFGEPDFDRPKAGPTGTAYS